MLDTYVLYNGLPRKAKDIHLVEQVEGLKRISGVNPWPVIDFLIKAWADRAPEDVEAMHIVIEEYRQTLFDPKFGQTKEGKDFGRRFTIDFPKKLMMMIRSVYSHEELPMESKFFAEFAGRYPFFKIPDKI